MSTRRTRPFSYRHTFLTFILFPLLPVIGIALLVWWFWLPHEAWWFMLVWVLWINPVTFGTYRYDKRIAGTTTTRPPERFLWLEAALGGTLAAFAAMYAVQPRHKTQDTRFKAGLFGITALQMVVLVMVIYVWANRAP